MKSQEKPALETVYVSRYALTKGVFAVQAQVIVTPRGEYAAEGGRSVGLWLKRGDWYRSRERALARANELLDKRIASLEKSLKKLRAIKEAGGFTRVAERP